MVICDPAVPKQLRQEDDAMTYNYKASPPFRFVAVLLILAMVNLAIGCKTYYKTSEYRLNKEQSLELLNEEIKKGKYFIVMQGDEGKEAEFQVLSDCTINVVLKDLSAETILMHGAINARHSNTYKPSKRTREGKFSKGAETIVQEVRIYLQPDVP